MAGTTQTLTFYHRPGCHLCDDMWQQLQEIRIAQPFDLVARDVESEPGLEKRFGRLVPVLAAGEEILCNYYLDPRALSDFLRRTHGLV